MKRLIDEPGDEATRLLLRAGVSHQPPRFGKLRLMTALGLGGAVGLSASKALAWLSSSGAKATLAVAVVGASAGAGYVLLPPRPAPLVLEASGPGEPAPAPELPGLPKVPATQAAAPEPAGAAELVERARPPAARARAVRSARRVDSRERTAPREEAERVEPPPAVDEGRSLREETLWVDRLRIAAERNDAAEFHELSRDYERRFPGGQLALEARRLRDVLSESRASLPR